MANRIRQVQGILDQEGWSYEHGETDILLIAAYGTRKWKMDISCADEGQVSCFAVFPWPIPEAKRIKVLVGLNELNLHQRSGCFMINPADSRVIHRCGVHILDEYASTAGIKNVLLSSVASVNANWEKVYMLIYGIAEGSLQYSGPLKESLEEKNDGK